MESEKIFLTLSLRGTNGYPVGIYDFFTEQNEE
jgi:hypothetical protein